MHRVIITGPAKRDIQGAYDWWAENRRLAQERGITEDTIDRAIHRRRYGE